MWNKTGIVIVVPVDQHVLADHGTLPFSEYAGEAITCAMAGAYKYILFQNHRKWNWPRLCVSVFITYNLVTFVFIDYIRPRRIRTKPRRVSDHHCVIWIRIKKKFLRWNERDSPWNVKCFKTISSINNRNNLNEITFVRMPRKCILSVLLWIASKLVYAQPFENRPFC